MISKYAGESPVKRTHTFTPILNAFRFYCLGFKPFRDIQDILHPLSKYGLSREKVPKPISHIRRGLTDTPQINRADQVSLTQQSIYQVHVFEDFGFSIVTYK